MALAQWMCSSQLLGLRVLVYGFSCQKRSGVLQSPVTLSRLHNRIRELNRSENPQGQNRPPDGIRQSAALFPNEGSQLQD